MASTWARGESVSIEKGRPQWRLPNLVELPRLRRAAIALAVLAVLVVAFSVPWKLNFLRGYIGERVKEATGRELVIEGDIWWHWGRQGRLVAERVALRQSAVGRPTGDADGRQARRAHRRCIPCCASSSTRPKCACRMPTCGSRSTTSASATGTSTGSKATRAPRPSSAACSSKRLGCASAGTPPDRDRCGVARPCRVPAQSRMNIRATGLWNGLKLAAEGQGDDVLQLREADQPYGLNIAATVGNTRIKLDGQADRTWRVRPPPTSSWSSKARRWASGIASPTSASRTRHRTPRPAGWY